MVPLDLLSLQKAMKNSVLTGETASGLLDSLSSAGDITSENRLQIHRNNYRQSLVGALGGIFPATKAFVGDAFIEGALGEFVLEHPPITASLSDYGEQFPEFFSQHRASQRLPYIVDLLRLEWALHYLQTVDEASFEDGKGKQFSINPNARIVDSDYPLMSLWSVATGQLPPEAVHIEQGGQTVVALLTDGEVRLLSLSPAEASCLKALEVGDQSVDDAEALNSLRKKQIIFAI